MYHTITERWRMQEEVQLLQSMTLAIAQSQDFHTALSIALRQICETTGWNYGEAWIPRLDGTALECSPVWYSSHNCLEKFRIFSEKLIFTPGSGLPGRVWFSKESEWIQDTSLLPDSVFLRSQIAHTAGIKAGLGIPIIANNQVLAVLVFLMFESREEDRKLVELISIIASQLGSLIQQKRTEDIFKTQARVLESMVEGVGVSDEKGFILFTNAAFDTMFGYEQGELKGDRVSTINAYSPEENRLLFSEINLALQRQGCWFGEFNNRKKDGTLFTSYARISSLEIAGKKYRVFVIEDITDRKQAEDALRQSEACYRTISELTSDYVYAISITGEGQLLMEWVTESFQRVTGYTLEELNLSGGWEALIHPDDLPLAQQFNQTIASSRSDVLEYRIITKQGEIRWLRDYARPEWDALQQQVIRILGAAKDISESKQMEMELKESQRRLATLINSLPGIVFSCANDPEWSMTYLSEGCFNLTGYSSEELVGESRSTSYNSVLHPEDLPKVLSAIDAAVANKQPYVIEYRIRTKSGQQKWLWEKGNGVFAPNGEVLGLEGFITDITERKMAEEALLQAEQKYHGIFQNVVEGIFQTTIDGRYLTANPMLARIYGYDSPEELMTALTDIKHQLYVQSERRNEFMLLVQEQSTVLGFESQVYRKDGSVIWISESAHALYNAEGRVVGYEGTVEDITERKIAEATIQYQAFHDLLTDLPNRALFNDRLELSLTNAERSQDQMAVMFLDMDRFKTINDTLGHAVGDRLLQSVAQRLISCLREGDTVARWGGDEFTILLPQINAAEDAAKIAQRILDALTPPFYLETHELYSSSSIGIALYPQDGKDVQTLLKNADAALYRAKELGRNNYQFNS